MISVPANQKRLAFLRSMTGRDCLSAWIETRREAVLEGVYRVAKFRRELLAGIGTSGAAEMGTSFIKGQLWAAIDPLLTPATLRREKSPGRQLVSNRLVPTSVVFTFETLLCWLDSPSKVGCPCVKCSLGLNKWQALFVDRERIAF